MMFNNILVAVDLDDETGWARVLSAALVIARASDARVHLIHVVPGFGLSVVGQYFPEGTEERILAEAQVNLHSFAEEHVDADLRDSCVIGNGTVYQEILDGADRIGADLIVMGSHRPSMRDYLLGPNAARVVRHAPVSVLVVRD
jgi:nucleotide-binding universal stress UspA family protein